MPTTLVGKESQVTINISNTAGAAVDFKGANSRGANSADFLTTNNCPATLQPAQACQLNIVFKPVAAGTSTALLDLADDVTGVTDTALTISGAAALSVLTPSQITKFSAQQLSANLKSVQLGMQAQLGNINKRMRYLRFQDSTPGFQQDIGVSVNGKSVPVPNGSSDSNGSEGGGGGCGASGTQGGGSSEKCDKDKDARATRNGRWGAYITGSVGVSEDNLNSAKISTNGLTVGTDYRLRGKSAIGAAFEVEHHNVSRRGQTGRQWL